MIYIKTRTGAMMMLGGMALGVAGSNYLMNNKKAKKKIADMFDKIEEQKLK